MRWLIGLILAITPALGKDADGRFAQSPLNEWFNSQKNSKGELCCNEADGHLADYWNEDEQGLYADWNGRRWRIPPSAVLNGANPTGSAVIWIWQGEVRCFIKGPQG